MRLIRTPSGRVEIHALGFVMTPELAESIAADLMRVAGDCRDAQSEFNLERAPQLRIECDPQREMPL